MPYQTSYNDSTGNDSTDDDIIGFADDQALVDASDQSNTMTGEIGAAHLGQRIDRVLSEMIDGISRNRLQMLIADGALSVNDQTIGEASHRLKHVGSWRLVVPAPSEATPVAQAMALAIIHEDDDVIVVNKPVGLVVHPSAGHPDNTLVNGLLHHCRGRLSGIGGVIRPGIVHRLDRETSGLMVVARNDAAHAALTAQFSDRSLSRTYWAVVRGTPRQAEGRIEAPIGRSRQDRKKMAVVPPPGGRPAATRYRVLDQPLSGGAALVECSLETGRTHQIRVHMSHIGHPLLGDPVYGRAGASRLGLLAPRLRPLAASFPRQALHAVRLTFVHPSSGRPVTYRAAPPGDLTALIEGLEMGLPDL